MCIYLLDSDSLKQPKRKKQAMMFLNISFNTFCLFQQVQFQKHWYIFPDAKDIV